MGFGFNLQMISGDTTFVLIDHYLLSLCEELGNEYLLKEYLFSNQKASFMPLRIIFNCYIPGVKSMLVPVDLCWDGVTWLQERDRR